MKKKSNQQIHQPDEFAKSNLISSHEGYESLKFKKLKAILLIAALLSSLATVLIGLLVAYLVYYPKRKNEAGVLNGAYLVSDHIGLFVVAMVFSATIVAFTILIVLTSKKQLIIDDTTNLAKLTSIGFIASFTDAIFVGSYVTTMGLNKAFKTKMVPSKMPGNMTIGYAPAQILESTIFSVVFDVDIVTLVVMMVACIIGGLVGSWVSKYVNNQIFRLFSGISLFIFGIIMILVHPNIAVIAQVAYPTVKLVGWRLAIGIIAYFILGIFSALGLGIFAPSLAILALLGLEFDAIAVIMSVGAAAMMPPAAIKFIKDKNYDPKTVILFLTGGLWGCLICFLVIYLGIQIGAGIDWDTFKDVLKWIAIVVTFYCSLMMLFDFVKIYGHHGWNEEGPPKSEQRNQK